jgi:porphobilinogen synthase
MSIIKPSNLTANFIVAEDNDPIDSKGRLPYVRESELAAKAVACRQLGIETCKIFTFQNTKLEDGEQGLEDGNLMTRAIRILKFAAPDLQVMPEVCACAYTCDGECVITHGTAEVDHSATHDYVGKMAVLHAAAGADVIVAGLTHKGSVRAIRNALDANGYNDRGIMASIQFRSKFYGPYRSMMRTEPVAGNTFRSHLEPGDFDSTLAIVDQYADEGATEYTLQPILPNMDAFLKVRNATTKPLTAYSVSTELGLICDSGLCWDDNNAKVTNEYYESLLRLGADRIMSYVAIEMAQWLAQAKLLNR